MLTNPTKTSKSSIFWSPVFDFQGALSLADSQTVCKYSLIYLCCLLPNDYRKYRKNIKQLKQFVIKYIYATITSAVRSFEDRVHNPYTLLWYRASKKVYVKDVKNVTKIF